MTTALAPTPYADRQAALLRPVAIIKEMAKPATPDDPPPVLGTHEQAFLDKVVTIKSGDYSDESYEQRRTFIREFISNVEADASSTEREFRLASQWQDSLDTAEGALATWDNEHHYARKK